ncbi:hypothetical protein ERX27_07465 [Macrococcus brunensis]|uniref:DUF3168 domain-containing protein n=1 Tax=Macrococcus brunensis TaxID=198483 RepID=A0A4V3BDA8_9STAP|nr:hypothetical protein [Macrococcus brunensis]TDL96685.1 hypothetical protein ERX27_07465 [Macrococcus brunensis]
MTVDILTMVYDAIKDDELIAKYVGNRIKFNDYPDALSMTEPYIVLDDIDDPVPVAYIDGDESAYSYIVQVDVFVKYSTTYKARLVRNEISERIQRLLWEKLKMGNVTNFKPDYNKDLKLYSSTRRYETIIYRDDLKSSLF